MFIQSYVHSANVYRLSNVCHSLLFWTLVTRYQSEARNNPYTYGAEGGESRFLKEVWRLSSPCSQREVMAFLSGVTHTSTLLYSQNTY